MQPSSASNQAVIIAARRTPIVRAHGLFKRIDVCGLLTPLIHQLLADSAMPASEIDDVIIGNATASSGNIARLAALSAGLPITVPGVTVDRQCGSGLEAIIQACRQVQAGAGDVYLAGGVESISTAPWRMERPQSADAQPRFFSRARFAPDSIGDPDMGVAAENVARHCGVTRDRQDALALQSHQRAVAAQQQGLFAGELVAINTSSGVINTDEGPRASLSKALLARMKPVFDSTGTVTAGNCCQHNDGAALVLVVSAKRAQKMGLPVAMKFCDATAAGVDPNLLGLGPVPATRKLLRRNPHISLPEIDLIEFNEAFAAQVLGALYSLGIPAEKINREGGAIALGHPYGASGAVLVTRLFSQMQRNDSPGQHGLATLGIGGGLGLSALFEYTSLDIHA
ncbi:thiolase family protein [Gynuella sunshinyii]|uniref:Acetyl-CoA acetyltransferase n=1 Tax=Gynuella sunshinyii YC6258 TaxID=1445510 RepID=A0A0C5V0Y4_9GAMM|nr:thiolase family protein [Gynuella sunshinyii]AJQ93180.1 acetyl-CoA acetyltransferase [Gynuella sunshinyii YC6258]